jgi:hypothetical protein
MDLDSYIRGRPYGEHARIAREADVFYTTLTAIRQRRAVPKYETARRISDATGGAVSIAELCEPPPPKPMRARKGRPERVITQRGHR